MSMVYIGLTILFTVLGQILIKIGMMELGEAPSDGSLPAFIFRAFLNWKVTVGLGSAVLAAISWMLALSKTDISFAYPFMVLPIVLVLAIAPYAVGESVPLGRWAGVAIVCIGLVIASRF